MIICEVGLNHNGSKSYSLEYANSLSNSLVDGFTFQIREPDFYKNSKYSYLNLNKSTYSELSKIAHKHNKLFGIALADTNLISTLESINLDFYKILSWDFNNYKFIDELLELDKPLYISTGMASVKDLNSFAVNYRKSSQAKKKITLIHTQLSHNEDDVNLRVIQYIKNNYVFNVAFGNHCENLSAIYSAVPFEPSDIFFYVKGNKIKHHIDELHSVNIDKVNHTINTINIIYKMIGDEKKIASVIQDKYLIQNVK